LRACLLYGSRDLRLDEIETPRILDDEVLIKVEACGICPSDLRRWTGQNPIVKPTILGHESVGEIVQVGKDVEGYEPGERVARDWRDICGECYYCRRGIFNFCEVAETPERLRFRGGFCEYNKARWPVLRRIPDGISYEEASFSEPLACCINGIRQSNIQLGDDVAIIGCGPIGLQLLQLSKVKGARIIAVDLIEDRLKMAGKLGAHDVVNAGEEDTVDAVKALTDGRGVNAAIVAVGGATPIGNGMKMLDYGGSVNIFAGTYPKAEIPFDPNPTHYKHYRITGSHDFTPHDFTTALKLIQYGIVDVKSLISHILPLERTQEGFEIVESKQGLKVIIKPHL
jgi:L-iditol 2-dehydrogenase